MSRGAIREIGEHMDATQVCARDLMQTDVKTVRESDTVSEVAVIMREEGFSSVVVERENERDAFGIVTRKDIVEALDMDDLGEAPRSVEEVMTKPAIAVAPELSIHHCVQMMRMVGVRRMPVVGGDGLVGILSNTDVFKWMVSGVE